MQAFNVDIPGATRQVSARQQGTRGRQYIFGAIALSICVFLAIPLLSLIWKNNGTDSGGHDYVALTVPSEWGQFCWTSKVTPGVVIATYASGSYTDFLPTFRLQAEALNARLLVFGPENISDLKEPPQCKGESKSDWDASEIPCVPPPYAGTQCFKWKPLIVQQAWDQMREDEDVLIYFDSRTLILGDLSWLVEEVRQHGSGLFAHVGRNPWESVKRAVWDNLSLDPRTVGDQGVFQTSASAFGLSKRHDASIQLLKTWTRMAMDPYLLCNCKARSGNPEYDGFVYHQHDQALLTAICVAQTGSTPCHVIETPSHYLIPSVGSDWMSDHHVICGCGAGDWDQHDADCRANSCRDEAGPLCERPAGPEAMELLGKYLLGKKLRSRQSPEELLPCELQM
ncbi:unnamed protein product [Prorocentrum cordatum]|uniref:Protein xylosyltransferase n=1 Tax=Prorocentrum cordatum TaxID=2364126 RepID=A0ABN9S5A6_9DINO|nr:unnamed protein product [Polarella glacialis]